VALKGGGAADPRLEVGEGLTAGPHPLVTGRKKKRRGCGMGRRGSELGQRGPQARKRGRGRRPGLACGLRKRGRERDGPAGSEGKRGEGKRFSSFF
jgi:hypothetical protein